MLSFVVPAHDEEALIAATVESIRRACAALAGPFEVVVVDDASADRTAQVARAAGARVVPAEVRQISAARNVGARAARGDRLIFVDADTTVSASVVAAARAAFERGAVGGGCAVRFDEPVPLYVRVALPVALWINRRLRSAAGCFVFARRDAFEAVGGFDQTLFAGEEVLFSRALRRRGRFVVLREHVVTSGRKLRAYSALEILGLVARLATLGRRGVRDRSRLALWYGPRRADPGRAR